MFRVRREIYITIWKINCFVKHSRKPVSSTTWERVTVTVGIWKRSRRKFQNLCFPC